MVDAPATMPPRHREPQSMLLALLLLLCCADPVFAARDLLQSGGEWQRVSWKKHGVAERDVAVSADEGPRFRLSAEAPNDIRLVRRLPVKAGRFYRFSARVRTEGVVGKVGANLSVDGTWNRSRVPLTGTTGWTPVQQVFRAAEDGRLAFALRLGYWNATARGTAWFDQVALEELETWSGGYEPVRPSSPQGRATTTPLRLAVLVFVVPFLYGGLAWLRRDPGNRVVPASADRSSSATAGVWVLLGTGLLVRLLFVPGSAPWAVPPAFEAWALYLAGFFGEGSAVPPEGVAVPPPAWLYWLGLTGTVVKTMALENSRVFNVLLQLPAIGVELAVLAVVLAALRPRFRAGAFWLPAGFLVFHPGLLIATSLAGSPAALGGGLVLLSLLAVAGARPLTRGALLGLGLAAAPVMLWLVPPVAVWYRLRFGGRAMAALLVAALALPALATFPVRRVYEADGLLASAAMFPGTWPVGSATGATWAIAGAALYLLSLVLLFRWSSRGKAPALPLPAGEGADPVWPYPGLLAITLAVMAALTGLEATLLYTAVVLNGLLLASRGPWRWTFLLLGLMAAWHWGYGYYAGSSGGAVPPAGPAMTLLLRAGIAGLALLSWWVVLSPATAGKAAAWWRASARDLAERGRGLLRSPSTVPVPPFRLTRSHLLALAVLWAGYFSLIAHDMGERLYPLNPYRVGAPAEVFEAVFPEPVSLGEVRVYTGANGYGAVRFETEDADGWQPLWSADGGRLRYKGGQRERRSTFKQLWRRVRQDHAVERVRLTLTGEGLDINEIVFLDNAGKILVPATLEGPVPSRPTVAAPTHPLFDEGHRITAEKSYRAKTYWDEVYYARSAYELANGLAPYEKSHPPLGKVLIAWGVDVFGMTPFGWRFMDAFVVSLLPLLLWVAARDIFGTRLAAYGAALLAVFELVFFIHGRWANIDTFLAFFLTVSLLALLRWYREGNGGFSRANLGWFLAAGFFFGCAVATKWSALFTGFAVFVLWVIARVATVVKRVSGPPAGRGARLAACLRRELPVDLGAWGAVFVVLPALVYFFSYASFLATLPGSPGPFSLEGWQAFVDQQLFQWHFHADKETGHRSSSMFFTWPLMLQPASMLTLGGVPAGTKATINIIGNPVIWWTGLAAMLALGWRALLGRDEVAVFLAGIYFLQGLPWLLVSRTTYLYHYLPFLPLLILGIVYWLARLDPGRRIVQVGLAVFALLVVAGFVALYPYVTGTPVPLEYTRAIRVFDGWSRL